ncbi:MAG: hypothetical protein ACYTFA_07475 [Planctomycetota bacterium]|jgi:hypothetical protein
MTTVDTDLHCRSRQVNEESTRASVAAIEQLLDQASTRMFDAEYYVEVEAKLRQLHARMRAQHGSAAIAGSGSVPPELTGEYDRLRAEHTTMIGRLDRIIRSVESLVDLPLEDKDVFFMRVRELTAMLRRHEAEENRLCYLTVWRDVGGES